VAGGGYVNLFLDRGRFARALHHALHARRSPRLPGSGHRRAHEHQPQQGGPHRAYAQRLPRGQLRPTAPP
jgi:hypothetical protein